MLIEDLVICPLSEIVYVIEPNKNEEDMYKGTIGAIPNRLMKKEITCLYSAYNEHENIAVLIINIK